MTRKATNKKSTRVTKKDIFETLMAIRMRFGEQDDQFRLETTKTSVRMIVFSQESLEQALPDIQETLDEQKCKAPLEILLVLKTLTARPKELELVKGFENPPEEFRRKLEALEGRKVPDEIDNKLSLGLRAYLAEAAIPGNKGIDVSVHLVQPMTPQQVDEKLVALLGRNVARVNDSRLANTSNTWVVRVKRASIEKFNQADWVTKVNRYYGEAQAYSANDAG